MSETAITIQDITGPFEAVTAGSADFTFDAGDVGNGNSFVCTGREVLLVQNTHADTAKYVTVSSVDDEKGRSEDITTYSLAAGDFVVFGIGLTNSKGWKDSAGLIILAPESTDIEFAVLRLP